MDTVAIRKISLPQPGLDLLQVEARAEGYSFIDRLIDEWESGANRFEGHGEILCGYLDDGLLVAVGALTRDPFADSPHIGRIRRVYVRANWRNRKIGGDLVTTLLREAAKNFRCVRLRAENPAAARLYERLGFLPIDSPDATHMQVFVESRCLILTAHCR
jgi:GNAT superfamily N-acetyltransferase